MVLAFGGFNIDYWILDIGHLSVLSLLTSPFHLKLSATRYTLYAERCTLNAVMIETQKDHFATKKRLRRSKAKFSPLIY